jgi:hypothetical protein
MICVLFADIIYDIIRAIQPAQVLPKSGQNADQSRTHDLQTGKQVCGLQVCAFCENDSLRRGALHHRVHICVSWHVSSALRRSIRELACQLRFLLWLQQDLLCHINLGTSMTSKSA